MIVLYEVDKKQYHYYTEKTFSNLNYTSAGNLQIFKLPIKNWMYFVHVPDWFYSVFSVAQSHPTLEDFLTYECLSTGNSTVVL